MQRDKYTDRKVSVYSSTNNEKVKTDCLWRIASYFELFGADLDSNGSLTDEQQTQIKDWVKGNY